MSNYSYVEAESAGSDLTYLFFSDLAGMQNPHFVLPSPGETLIALKPERQSSYGFLAWQLAHAFRVTDIEETGDAFALTLSLVFRGSDGKRPILLRNELLANYHWIPAPSWAPQPVPASLNSLLDSLLGAVQ